MQSLIRSESAGVTGGRGTAGAGPGRDLLYGALDRTAELLAKLLSGSEDSDMTALSEAVKAKLGITEPLSKSTLLSPSPGLRFEV